MTNNNMISKEDFNNHQVCAAGHEKTSMSQNPVTVNPKVAVKKDSNHQAGETTEAEPTAANPNPLAVYREIANEEDAGDDDGVELISEVANNEDSDHEFADVGPEIEENPFAVYPEVAVEPIAPQADLSRLGLMWWEEEWSETDYQNLRHDEEEDSIGSWDGRYDSEPDDDTMYTAEEYAAELRRLGY